MAVEGDGVREEHGAEREPCEGRDRDRRPAPVPGHGGHEDDGHEGQPGAPQRDPPGGEVLINPVDRSRLGTDGALGQVHRDDQELLADRLVAVQVAIALHEVNSDEVTVDAHLTLGDDGIGERHPRRPGVEQRLDDGSEATSQRRQSPRTPGVTPTEQSPRRYLASVDPVAPIAPLWVMAETSARSRPP